MIFKSMRREIPVITTHETSLYEIIQWKLNYLNNRLIEKIGCV